MKAVLIILCVLSALLLIGSIAMTLIFPKMKCSKKQRHRQYHIVRIMYVATVIVVIFTVICSFAFIPGSDMPDGDNSVDKDDNRPSQTGSSKEPTTPSNAGNGSAPTTSTTPSGTPGTSDPSTATTPTATSFTPVSTPSSNPNNWGVQWEIIEKNQVVDSYTSQNDLSFGDPDDYFELPGICTFRGNNYRNSAVYGNVTVTNNTLNEAWSRQIGSLNGWPGSGWTGQPLIVQWDQETKNIMNMFADKKAKENLVEVIYATLDGYIRFCDLDDGSYTRNPINVGMNFKGAGSLDPRGYPLLYVGSGDYYGSKVPRMYIISLIDGRILYERDGKDPDALRPDWTAFDSCPLVHKESDTLIWPGENGILYTIKLNTQYDKSAGTLKIAPEDIVKTRYNTTRSNTKDYWLGYEPSCVIVSHYLYISENGGMFFCIDLNTMELVWSQDTRDDSNSTPVFEWVGDEGYIYTAPSLHWTAENAGDYTKGYISIYKLNAKTGEIIWEQRFDCNSMSGVSGGVQSTPLLGKPGTELEGLIIYSIARTPGVWDGKMVAFDTKTGEIVWEWKMNNYTWSSPIALYNESGKAYIIVCDSYGNMFLLDSKANVLSKIYLGSNIEASPAAFGNTIIVGTRGNDKNPEKIYAIKIS